MQHEVEEDRGEGLTDALKGAAVALALVATIPIFIPTAACVLAFTEIKEKLKRCPNCGSRRLIFKGKEHRESAGCMEISFERGTFKRRKSPIHSYFECADCTGRFKKFYGSPLEPASEEEFEEMSVNSF
ncbi:MAG: hypothetical protein HYX67_02890 [Candidatus Melainabacteria bacterium]|nr:hypothetical protein [Candidatus Melainabacteria bacterium]